MSELPSPILRALAGLDDGCGRTLVIAGPSFSGKSALLEEVRSRAERAGTYVVNLRGVYRDRETPFAAIDSLKVGDESGPPAPEAAPPEDPVEAPLAESVPYVPTDAPEPRRPGGRRRGVVLGRPYVTPARRAGVQDPGEYWSFLVQGLGTRYPGVAILVEDASLMDQESRGFLLDLTERARYRPVLLVFALDTQVAPFADWQEQLVGRADVDWVRFDRAKPDERERPRVEEAMAALPESARRATAFLALMHGSVPEVTLGRVMGASGAALRATFEPAIKAGVVKSDQGVVSLTHAEWVDFIGDLVAEPERHEMHHQIALAMQALSAEPNLQRRVEIAHHFFEWEHGTAAFRSLLEAEEVAERLLAFDMAHDLIGQAIACVHGLSSAERAEAFADLKLAEVRVLVGAGRPHEAGKALAEGVNFALRAGVPEVRVEELVEGVVPILRAAGPRKEFLTELPDLAERCHDARAKNSEVLLLAVLAEYELLLQRVDRARTEARRAAYVARRLPPSPAQAVAMFAMALSHLEGSLEQRSVAEKFLKSSQALLAHSRRYGLQQQAEEYLLYLRDLEGERAAALRGRERAIAVAQRLRAPALELNHQLGVAQSILDSPSGDGTVNPRARTTLQRAGEIVDQLHLVPPSPGLLRLWLLEGRLEVVSKHADLARLRWQAIADLTPGHALPRVSAEATARLAILEGTDGNDVEAQRHLERLAELDSTANLPPDLADQVSELRQRLTVVPPGPAEPPQVNEGRIDG